MVNSFMAGMVIRLLGTVALFAVCRYQMAELTHLVAVAVLGWYVLLTITEVGLLAWLAPSRISPDKVPPSVVVSDDRKKLALSSDP